MIRKTPASILSVMLLAVLLACSCAKKEEQEKQDAEHKHVIQYIEEDVSFGIFFDPEGTKRTLELGPKEREFTIYIFIHFPEYLEINAAEFRLELPEGVEITNDKYYEKRNLSMGRFDPGISEAFPCVTGPKILLHTLSLQAKGKLENAVLSILPHESSEQVAVTKCAEGYPVIKASAYLAVVNPDE